MKFTGGLPETECGLGSTTRMTEGVRAALSDMLGRCRTKVLLDAPCGDCNWISQVDLRTVRYVGVDDDGRMLLKAASRMKRPIDQFRQLDVIEQRPPRADTVLCRDFLQHLPNFLAARALIGLMESWADWFLLTSHDVEVNEDLEEVGGFRPLSLTQRPFDLGEPSFYAEDCGRILGAWPRSTLVSWRSEHYATIADYYRNRQNGNQHRPN